MESIGRVVGMGDEMKIDAWLALDALLRGLAAAAASVRRFNNSLAASEQFNYAIALAAYKRQVGRLPGSERTSRLRKKRRDAVLRWAAQRNA